MDKAACHFVFTTGPQKGEAQAFETARISVGRAASCDLRLEAFQLEQVAPHHAEILMEDGPAYFLYDLGSKTGVFVNEERVGERCELLHEDYVRFGAEGPELIFRIGYPLPGKQPMPQIFPVAANLTFFSGSDADRMYPIDAAVTSNIGRRADLEVPLDPRGDMIVSGNHCNIRYVNGHFVITDTSRNGTYVNNGLVDQPMEILDGDVIMLGDGGPQARFHVNEARRNYPNHRPLTGKAKPDPVTSGAFPAAPSHNITAPATLASAKPFATGSAVVPPAAPPAEPTADSLPWNPDPEGPGAEAMREALLNPGSHAPDDADAATPVDHDITSEPVSADAEHSSSAGAEPAAASSAGETLPSNAMPGAAPAATATPAAADINGSAARALLRGKQALAAVPRNLNASRFKGLKRNQKLALAGAGALLLAIVIAMMVSGGDKSDTAQVKRDNYGKALAETKTVTSDEGALQVEVPTGWSVLNRENFVSVESLDKEIAVDYVRDARIDDAHVKQLLTKDGASITATNEQNADGEKVEVMTASLGNLRRLASLRPAGGVPVMAFMETTEDALGKLSEKELDKLLVQNVKPTGTPAVAAPAASSPPAPAAPASPAEAVASTGSALPAPAAATPAPSPAEPPTSATQTNETLSTPTGPVIKSKSLKLSLTAPAGWKGKSEEADEMISLDDGNGLVIRIARDPSSLDAPATFKAMEEEGWTSEGVKNTSHYQAGEFSRKDQNLLLVIVPEKGNTTMLVYATSAKDFTDDQRYGIRDVLVQLLPQD